MTFDHYAESVAVEDIALLESLDLAHVEQSTNYSCGAAALAACCQYFGVEPDAEGAAMQALGSSPSDGTSPGKMIEVAVEQGLTATVQERMTIADLSAAIEAGSPVIVHMQMHGTKAERASGNAGHYVVVIGVAENVVLIQDPARGRVEMLMSEFKRRWWDRDADGTSHERFGIVLSRKVPVKQSKRKPRE